MSKQSAEGQHDTRKQKKNRLDLSAEPIEESASEAGHSRGLVGLGDDPSIQTQAAQLADTRIQSAQRVALAAQIGRVQGNQHLQRVMAEIQRCEVCGDPSHVPGEETPNDFRPLPDQFYEEVDYAGREAQDVRDTASTLLNWVQGAARMPLEDAIRSIDQADQALAAAIGAAEESAEQAADERASPDLLDAANAAIEDLLAASALAQDVIEPIQEIGRAGLFRVFAAINRGLGAQAQQLIADIQASQARVNTLRQQAEAAGRELGESFAQFGLDLALGGVGLALTAMFPPVGIAFSICSAGGSMIWDRMLGPSGSHTPSDVNASTSISTTGLNAYSTAGSGLARATSRLGPATIGVGAVIDGLEVADAIRRYETLPGQVRTEQETLDALLRRYQALGPFVQGYRSAEARARSLEARASRLERSAATRNGSE